MTRTIGREERTAMAKKLWQLQEQALTLAVAISEWQAGDESLARTLGDEGEYFEDRACGFAKDCKAVALRLDRLAAFTN